MNDQLADYLEDLLPLKENWITDLEKQARKDNVPIMESAGIHYVTQLIQISKPKRILEIGTAIGYSALRMLDAFPATSIMTIERDEVRYLQAKENIKRLGKEKQIEIVYGDALEKMQELQSEDQSFDLIFIDAAKGQYKRFFELSVLLLSNNGIVITDNVLFRGYVVENSEEIPKRYQKMVEKIKIYNEFLMNHPKFTTSITPIGDGVAVSYMK